MGLFKIICWALIFLTRTQASQINIPIRISRPSWYPTLTSSNNPWCLEWFIYISLVWIVYLLEAFNMNSIFCTGWKGFKCFLKWVHLQPFIPHGLWHKKTNILLVRNTVKESHHRTSYFNPINIAKYITNASGTTKEKDYFTLYIA